jgi:hypothetical protein
MMDRWPFTVCMNARALIAVRTAEQAMRGLDDGGMPGWARRMTGGVEPLHDRDR